MAVKKLRAEKGWPRTKPPHEIVNHSEGEIVNANGYSTNAIEAKWSVAKRWIRSKVYNRLCSTSSICINDTGLRSSQRC